jgi:hypothetical protein
LPLLDCDLVDFDANLAEFDNVKGAVVVVVVVVVAVAVVDSNAVRSPDFLIFDCFAIVLSCPTRTGVSPPLMTDRLLGRLGKTSSSLSDSAFILRVEVCARLLRVQLFIPTS